MNFSRSLGRRSAYNRQKTFRSIDTLLRACGDCRASQSPESTMINGPTRARIVRNVLAVSLPYPDNINEIERGNALGPRLCEKHDKLSRKSSLESSENFG